MNTDLRKLIEDAWDDRQLLEYRDYQDAIETVVLRLNRGELRVAEPIGNRWHINDWIKKAINMYLPIRKMETIEAGPFTFHDKMKLKSNFKDIGARVAPPSLARYGAFLGKGVTLLPSYVHIGSYIDEGTTINTWSSVGSGAQIGKQVQICDGVIIGGMLDPDQKSPVIIEDDCFIGHRCLITEGVLVEKESILAANVVLTASTKIIDVSTTEVKDYKSVIPKRSIVIAGSYTQKFTAGEFQTPCALIVGKRAESSDKKASLKQVLRDYKMSI